MAVVEPGQELDEPLSERQIDALRRLEEMGASPRKSVEDPYDSDPKIRALQLLHEGRIGGPNRGQGRKRKPRVSEELAKRFERKVDKMETAIDRGLDSDNEKVAVDTVKTVIKVIHDEASLQLAEQKVDAELAKMTKEDLVADLFALAGDPSIVASIQGFVTLPESQVEEITDAEVVSTDDNGASATAPSARTNTRSARSNGRGAAKADRRTTKNPWAEAAKRRSSN